jgi:hypothetical protein
MKRWFFTIFLLFTFIFTIIGILSSQVSFPLILPTNKVRNGKFYDYSGITHAHTLLSTGSGTVLSLAKAAALAHCNFLIVTDLNPYQKKDNDEGYHNEVLVIEAGEYSYLTGHLLAYDLPEAKRFKGAGQTQIFFNDLLDKKKRNYKDGFLIAAHPFLPQHSWENIESPGLDGMEVINLDSIWHRNISRSKFGILWSFIILPFNPDLSYLRLYTEPDPELIAWDQILKEKSFVGFGGNDSTANAIPFPNKSFQFPSYTRSFRLLKNHILLRSELTGAYAEDRKKIMTALANGNSYFSVDLVGDPTGFYFTAQQRRLEVLPGQTLKASGGPISFVTDLGHDIGIPHEIMLLKNGQKVAGSNSASINYVTHEPGAYRVIVRVAPVLPFPDGRREITWIFSNAIRIE